MRLSSRRIIAGLLALTLVGALPACGSGTAPDGTLRAFLDGWQQGRLTDRAPLLGTDGQPLPTDQAQTALIRMAGDLAVKWPKLTVSGKPKVKKDDATAFVNVEWPITDKATWRYATSVRLHRSGDKWRVRFDPKSIHPDLTDTGKLTVRTETAKRGEILDGAGQPVMSARPVVNVGVQRSLVKDINALVKELTAAFTSIGVQVDLSGLPGRVSEAQPDAFIDVITLREPDYDKISARIKDLDGTVFTRDTLQLAENRTFARALLGTVGAVQKDDLDKNPGKYRPGDQIGRGGLQGAYDAQLRGADGVSVVLPGADAANDRELFSSEPAAGKPLKTTLDANIQRAAEAALAAEQRRSAIVAVRISDGAVLAVANGPGAADLNLALTGAVPPGSTFKMVTALAVLDAGVTIDTTVDCPKTLTVEGRSFKNSHDMALGSVPFRTDFAKSCNTAFASLAPKLGGDGLAKTAATLGIGGDWDIGLETFTGKVSNGGSAAEQAAAAFGQGRTQVSPLTLAGAAAAVARGQWKQPRLVVEPAPEKTAPDGPQLKPESVTGLKTMMREVVTSGTATAVKGVPGEPIHGKTGTAEYDDNPEHTHSWFVGFRGDVAFAVFVENGGASTDSAVPMAGRFLTAVK